MEAIECMKTRRSIRSFKDTPIPRDVIQDIVDCGRMAATAINIQPWRFVVVQDRSLIDQIAEITDHGKFIAQAPVCVAVFCENVKYYLEDGSAATQNILNAARAYGLGSCWVAGDKKEYAPKIGKMLDVPDNYKLISLIPIGYTDHVPNPAKKPIGEVVKWK